MTTKTKKEKKTSFGIHQSLLLPRDMFKSAQAQLIVSTVMVGVLLVQLYLFFSLNSMMAKFMTPEVAQLVIT